MRGGSFSPPACRASRVVPRPRVAGRENHDKSTYESLTPPSRLRQSYPLHPPGKPENLRADHLPDVPVPQLFLSGTKDPLCDLALLRPVLRRIGKKARLVTVDGGDHSLAVKRSRRWFPTGPS